MKPASLLLLATSLLLAACAQLPQGEVRLALQDIAAGSGDSQLKRLTPPPERQTLDYRIDGRRYRADLYRTSQPPRAGIVLVPGVVPEGKDDPRLVAVAMTLARLRFAVLVPDIEGVRRFQVRGADVQAVADAFRYLLSRPALCPEDRAGIAGFSYGAGPVLLAALQPDIRARVRFVLAMGGYHDLRRLVTYFTTSHYFDADSGRWRYHPADPYAAWVFALSNADLLERAADRSWLQDYVMSLADPQRDSLPPMPSDLGTDTRSLIALLRNREPERVPALIEALSPTMRRELEAINPADHDLSAMQALTILVHGRSDHIIHYSESLALLHALPAGRAQLFLIEGVAHVDVQLQEEDVARLEAAMTLLLEQRVRPDAGLR